MIESLKKYVHLLSSFFIRHPRLTIGFVAFTTRTIVAYIFYGSVDIDAFTEIIGCIVHDGPISYGIKNWNMLPSISFYLWFAGFLATTTPLLLAVCIKLIPIFCDVALALLLYEIVLVQRASHAFGVGLLYALCPVCIVVNAIHGQWESVFLFPFLVSFYVREYGAPSYTTSVLFGVLFGLSILIKPVGLLFLPFFFTPCPGVARALGRWWQLLKIMGIVGVGSAVGTVTFLVCTKYRLMDVYPFILHYRLTLSVVAFCALIALAGTLVGMIKKIITLPPPFKQYALRHLMAWASFMGVMGGAFLVFTLLKFNILGLLDTCLRYANKGPQGFGLRLVVSSVWPLLGSILENRLVLLLWVAVSAWAYYRQKIDVFDAMVIVFAGIFGFSGLCPHYLIWLVPCALLTGLYGSIGLYGFLATLLYAMYYNPPQHYDWAFLFRLSFAPLSSYSWLAPHEWLSANNVVLPLMVLVGNWLIPLSCWLMVWQVTIKNRHVRNTSYDAKKHNGIPGLWFMTLIIGVSGMILLLMCMTDHQALALAFNQVALTRYAPYAIVCNGACVLRSMDIMRAAALPYCNAVTLLLLWGVLWTLSIVWFGFTQHQKVMK
jgi:hypothetical protein